MNPDDIRNRGTYGRSGNPAKASSPAARRGPATAADWVAGARLRTLPLAIAPVALGTGAGVVAIADGPWHPARAEWRPADVRRRTRSPDRPRRSPVA